MICVECTNPEISCLYFKYKSKYIKLTICSRCGKVADKYIEYDNVILFLDTLLLKPQAYRHLAYNITETEYLKDNATNPGYIESEKDKSSLWQLKCSVLRYRRLIRLVTMMILFEVYLTWAYEAKKLEHSIIMDFILDQEIYNQYIFFILKLMLEQSALNVSIQYLFYKFFNWGAIKNKNINDQYQGGYYKSVLLITVLVASSIKLFPIIMLIWPYDRTTISTSIINAIGFLNTTEALKLVTNVDYLPIIIVLSISTVIKNIFSRSILGILVSYVSDHAVSQVLSSELNDTVNQFNNSIDFIKGLKNSLNT